MPSPAVPREVSLSSAMCAALSREVLLFAFACRRPSPTVLPRGSRERIRYSPAARGYACAGVCRRGPPAAGHRQSNNSTQSNKKQSKRMGHTYMIYAPHPRMSVGAQDRKKKTCSTLKSPSYPSAAGDSEAGREGWGCAR
eukprot:scaffold8183_cov122-Isochrysis_galbana.AAC.5